MNTQCVPRYFLSVSNSPGDNIQCEGIKRPQLYTDFEDFAMKFSISWLITVVHNLLCYILDLNRPKLYYFYYLPNLFRTKIQNKTYDF